MDNNKQDLFDIVTVYNPSKKDFQVFYNSSLHKTIPAGKAINLVKLVAGDSNHGAIKHLIDYLCREQGVNKNDPTARAKWHEIVVRSSQANAIPVIPTLEDQALRISQTLPEVEPEVIPTPVAPITPDQVDTSNIEIVEQASSGDVAIDPSVVPHPDSETNSILEGMRSNAQARQMPEQVITEEAPQVPEAPVKEKATREELMAYAANIMDLNDPTTKATVDKMDDDTLAKELKYYDVA